MSFKPAIAILLCGFNAFALTPEKITVPVGVSSELKSFEPSAILHMSDLNSYLVASDDTTDDDRPLLFQMNEKGEIDSSVIEISGVKKMTDIESISQDETGLLYIMSSQGLNKNGKDKEERNLFVRAERNGTSIQAKEILVLRPLLLEAIKKSKLPELKKIKKATKAELDIESHFVRNGELYIGLKNPQTELGVALILKAGNVDEIFENSEVELEVWQILDFRATTGEHDLLSDMFQVQDGLMITTTQDKGGSRVWSFNETTKQLTMLQQFDDHKAEGLTQNGDSTMVVFDQGEGEAHFAFGKF